MGGRYRLTKSTMGIAVTTRLATTIPEDSILEIVTPPLPHHRTVQVVWQGNPMRVFIEDLADRAKRIDPRLPRQSFSGLRVVSREW